MNKMTPGVKVVHILEDGSIQINGHRFIPEDNVVFNVLIPRHTLLVRGKEYGGKDCSGQYLHTDVVDKLLADTEKIANSKGFEQGKMSSKAMSDRERCKIYQEGCAAGQAIENSRRKPILTHPMETVIVRSVSPKSFATCETLFLELRHKENGTPSNPSTPPKTHINPVMKF